MIINGRPRGKILARRGLRQGDPLSPFLFTIVGDALINFCKERNIIKGFSIGSPAVEITHLQYADDVLIFCPFIPQMMENWWGMIHFFLIVSGLSLNIAKTTVIGINCSATEVNIWASTFSCKSETLPFTCLGFPLGGNHREPIFGIR